MDVIGFLLFFGIIIARLFGLASDSYSFIGAAIGLGLCAIADAIRWKGK